MNRRENISECDGQQDARGVDMQNLDEELDLRAKLDLMAQLDFISTRSNSFT